MATSEIDNPPASVRIKCPVCGHYMLVTDLPLTSRQRDIIPLVAEGMSNKDIAQALGISPSTVAVHMWRLRDKVHKQGRTAIAIEGLRLMVLEDKGST